MRHKVEAEGVSYEGYFVDELGGKVFWTRFRWCKWVKKSFIFRNQDSSPSFVLEY